LAVWKYSLEAWQEFLGKCRFVFFMLPLLITIPVMAFDGSQLIASNEVKIASAEEPTL